MILIFFFIKINDKDKNNNNMSLVLFRTDPNHYCFNLATFKKVDDSYILNSVRDFNQTEIHENSIGVLRIEGSEYTAWIIGIPKCLFI